STIVTLDGSGSRDPEGAALTYVWSQTGGPLVTLNGATTAMPSFVAPRLTTATPIPLTFSLTVSDGTLTSTADEVTITVKHLDRRPTAHALAPATANEGTPVTLDGSGSSDPDGDALLYLWTQTAGPAVNLVPNMSNNPRTSFQYLIDGPHCQAGQDFAFTLTVSDGIEASTTDPITVTIENVNQAPRAQIVADQVVCENAGTVWLSGSGADPDGDPISAFAWTQVGGPAVPLSS